MRKVTTLLVMVFVVALGAGVTAGMLASRLPGNAGSSVTPPEQHSWLAEQLGLTQDQSDKMRDIWEGVSTQSHECFTKADSLQAERDKEVTKILTADQILQYNKITAAYDDQLKALAAKRQDAFKAAVRHTMDILKPDQQKRYDQILKERVGHGPGESGWIAGGPSSVP